MTKNKGILKKIVDNNHVIFHDEKLGDIYFGNLYKFNNNLIGNTFNYEIVERYNTGNIELSKSGEWELIDMLDLFSSDDKTAYYFKNKNNKIISITLHKILLNEGKLGDYFNLELYKSYKIINWYPIKTEGFIPVIITQIITEGPIVAKTESNELISLYVCKAEGETQLDTKFIGKKIYIKYIPKYLTKIITATDNVKNVYTKEHLTIGQLKTLSNFQINTKFYQTRMCNDKLYFTQCKICGINVSEKIIAKTIEIKFTREIAKNKNGKYLLSGIINFGNFNLYVLMSNNISNAILIEGNPNLSGLVGNNFDFNILDLKIVSEITQSDTGKFLFKAIVDKKFIFEDINHNIVYTLLMNTDTPAESNVGKSFDLKLIPFLHMYSILDIKQ